ncbi:hypothetical protein BAME_31370 [Bacillus sp. M 2-6]|nr:hypothetical protein BAME_31370 [Bacillus sp. M 2-6]
MKANDHFFTKFQILGMGHGKDLWKKTAHLIESTAYFV